MSLQYLSDKESHPSQAHRYPVTAVCWAYSDTRDQEPPPSPAQGVVLSGDTNGNILAWDPRTAAAYRPLPRSHTAAISSITTNHAGSLALSSDALGGVALWDLGPFHTALAEEARAGNRGEKETDDLEAATADANGNATGTDTPPSRPLPVADGISLLVHQCDSLPQSVAATSSSDSTLSHAYKTALHPTLPLFASVGQSAAVSLHSLGSTVAAAGRLFGELISSADVVDAGDFGLALAFDPAGGRLAVSTLRGRVHVYAVVEDGLALVLESTFADHPSPVRALSFSSTGHLYAGGDDRILTIHDVKHTFPGPCQTQTQVQVQVQVEASTVAVAALTGHKGSILATAPQPSSESRIVASISADQTVKMWDLATNPKSCVYTAAEQAPVLAFCFQPLAATSLSAPPAHSAMNATSASAGASGFGTASRFVTASLDGRLRFYRSAGV
ncbi:WD40 repeat-like protein [Testicularia cyperi]|uniref:WD40 repeat-like protein n=1 Tax=Testicularia cyperi TaxID=1882483 RepID=A0A317XZD1_9BASI|nr:WD40 repeat-like protein [Testicularia cyperi]